MQLLLGYLNKIVEKHQDENLRPTKIIIICNEDEIEGVKEYRGYIRKKTVSVNKIEEQEDSKLEEVKKPLYIHTMEKVIGTRFIVSPCFDCVFNELLIVYFCKEYNEFINCNKNMISEIFKFSNYNNFRSLKRVVVHFKHIYMIFFIVLLKIILFLFKIFSYAIKLFLMKFMRELYPLIC